MFSIRICDQKTIVKRENIYDAIQILAPSVQKPLGVKIYSAPTIFHMYFFMFQNNNFSTF